jgi:diguanylate cyclase (GGDEF)-like protein/PAS domain S-box-containing protein
VQTTQVRLVTDDSVDDHSTPWFRSRLEALASLVPEFVVVYSPKARIKWVSRSAATYLGHASHELVGQGAELFVHPADINNLSALVAEELQTGKPPTNDRLQPGETRPTITARVLTATGEWRWVETTYVIASVRGETEVITTSRDIHDRMMTLRGLQARVDRDDLTGVANRSALMQFLYTQSTDDHTNTIVFCDLDNFKAINDDYGHSAGDEVLTAIARRAERLLRPDDFVARLGGDEFVFVLRGVTMSQAAKVLARLEAGFGQPIGSFELQVHASLGAAQTWSGGTPVEWIAAADAAMYRHKQNTSPR